MAARIAHLTVLGGGFALALGACGRSPVLSFYADAGGSRGSGAEDDDGDGHDGGGEQTCSDVDFLFVIDNSGSMEDNQAKLVANYDVFIGGIEDAIGSVESMHVGVVTTDAYPHNVAGCQSLGGLVVATGGPSSSGDKCGPYVEGHSFMTEADDLDEKFRCAARVGVSGSGAESPLTAGLAAISSPLVDDGECNEDFVRDGALLVIVIITDEEAEVDPQFAASGIIAVKGLDDTVVVLLANTPDGDCAIEGGARVGEGLASFASIFPHGFIGPICAADYTEVFTQAVDVVKEACGV
jgi:hypothetical protein